MKSKISELLNPEIDVPNFSKNKSKRPWNIRHLSFTSTFFHEHGYRYLGSGSFGATFLNKNNPNTVIKIFNPNDIAYTRFYSLAKRTSNVHFPEVSKIGYLDIEDDTLNNVYKAFIVVVEKLSPLTALYNNFVIFILYYIRGKADKFGNLTIERAKVNFAGSDLKKVKDGAYLNGESVFELFPELDEACNLLKSLVGNKTYGLDLNPSNIMLRGIVPVFTDPIFDARNFHR